MNETDERWSRVHPAIRVVCFLVLSLFLALGGVYHLFVAAFLLLCLYSLSDRGARLGCWPMLRRMRWFLLSIMVIYLWLSPGQPLVVMAGATWWMPTVEGLTMGLQRLTALLLMVVAVHWLLWATPRQQLVSALYWLTAPLAWFGFPRQRLAVRLALVLEVVSGVQVMVGQRLKAVAVSKGDMNDYANVTTLLLTDVISSGEQAVCQPVEIRLDDSPALSQWFWPLLLALLMSMPALMA